MSGIEPATLEDIQQIKQVLRDAWVATYQPFLSLAAIEIVTSKWHDPGLLATEIEDPEYFSGVARSQENEIVGVVSAALVEEGVLMIHRLYVHPNAQRQGIGDALLQASIAAFPTARRIRIEVATRNHIGRSFWRKQGFTEVLAKEAVVGDEVLEETEMEKPL